MGILVLVVFICVMCIGMGMLFAKHRGVLNYEPKEEMVEEVFKCGVENKIYVDITDEEKIKLQAKSNTYNSDTEIRVDNEKQDKSPNKSTKKKTYDKKKVKIRKKKK